MKKVLDFIKKIISIVKDWIVANGDRRCIRPYSLGLLLMVIWL